MSQHCGTSPPKPVSSKDGGSRSRVDLLSPSPCEVLDVVPLSIVPCKLTKFKRDKFPYAQSSHVASILTRGNPSKPNTKSSCPNSLETNTVTTDGHIKNIISQTLGIAVAETSQMPEVNL